jgi:L-lactate dehydrogenase
MVIDHLKWDPAKTIGLGTQLDTARFRSLIALATGLPPTQIKALILGEHGDSMVPIWSSATVGGVSLIKYPNFNAGLQQKIFDRTKNSGAECLKTKGGAGWAVGLTIAEVIHAISLNQEQMFPISTQLTGEYGIRGTCLSVPTTVNRNGVVKRHAIELWPREEAAISASAKALDATYAQIK